MPVFKNGDTRNNFWQEADIYFIKARKYLANLKGLELIFFLTSKGQNLFLFRLTQFYA